MPQKWCWKSKDAKKKNNVKVERCRKRRWKWEDAEREEPRRTKSTGGQKQRLDVQMWGCAKQYPRAEMQRVKAKGAAEHKRGDEEVPRGEGAKGECKKRGTNAGN